MLPLILLFALIPQLSQAGWIAESGDAYYKIKAINHWQGILAGILAVAFLKFGPTLVKHLNPAYVYIRYATAFVIAVVGVLILGFFIAEYWPMFETTGKFFAQLYQVMRSK